MAEVNTGHVLVVTLRVKAQLTVILKTPAELTRDTMDCAGSGLCELTNQNRLGFLGGGP